MNDNRPIVYATSTETARQHSTARAGILFAAGRLHRDHPCPECGYCVTGLDDHADGCSWGRGVS